MMLGDEKQMYKKYVEFLLQFIRIDKHSQLSDYIDSKDLIMQLLLEL